MKDKELLMKAIDSYSVYTDRQRKLLKMLINMAVDDVIVISVIELHKLSETSRPSIYKCIALFEKDEIIEPIKDIDGLIRLNTYRLNANKIDNIVRHYLKRQASLKIS